MRQSEGDVSFLVCRGGDGDDGDVISLKVFMAGWYGSGKTTFLECVRCGGSSSPTWEYTPLVAEIFELEGTLDGNQSHLHFKLTFWDWFVQMWDDGRRLMELSLPQTDVCILNYSVEDREHVGMLESYWMPTMKEYCPNCVFVLHAMQIDKRQVNDACMSEEEGRTLATKLNVAYYESSTMTQPNQVMKVVGGACHQWLLNHQKTSSKTKQNNSKCQIQ